MPQTLTDVFLRPSLDHSAARHLDNEIKALSHEGHESRLGEGPWTPHLRHVEAESRKPEKSAECGGLRIVPSTVATAQHLDQGIVVIAKAAGAGVPLTGPTFVQARYMPVHEM
jgi:hypothetical protein